MAGGKRMLHSTKYQRPCEGHTVSAKWAYERFWSGMVEANAGWGIGRQVQATAGSVCPDD